MEWTLIINLVMKLGMWWLDFSNAKAERKRQFLEWIKSVDKKSLSSVKLRDSWSTIREEMENDQNV